MCNALVRVVNLSELEVIEAVVCKECERETEGERKREKDREKREDRDRNKETEVDKDIKPFR